MPMLAEILGSLIPLSRDLGLDAEWFTLPPELCQYRERLGMRNVLERAA